ncbi:MAG: hypothetical protein KDA89_07155, partial [Planctomycetaceae bacterium]|nr:hypothetical protein [Planctomycetaceae bacterium]
APGAEEVQTAGAMCRFDHRKLVVVDGCCAWCGGMIFTHAARTQWDNLACLCEGPVVREFRNIFQQRWSEAGGCACDRIPARNDCGSFSGGEPDCPTTQPRCSQIPPVQSPSRAVENQYSTELGPDPQGTTSPTQLQADSNVPGRTPIRIVRTDVGDRSLRQSVYHAVDTARRCVLLENCYFTDDLLTEKLIAARRRGVDVRVILTICGNIEIVNRYVVLTANRLHRGGVRVWLAPRMTHVKAMSVDHCWSYIGSGNFDDLSLRNNRELGIIVSGAAFAGEMQSAVFTPHLSQASELLRPLPMRPSTLLAKMLGAWL